MNWRVSRCTVAIGWASSDPSLRRRLRIGRWRRSIDGSCRVAMHGTRDLEAKLRRTLKQDGYRLVKSRSRTPEMINYGTYTIVDEQNVSVAGEPMSLDDVAAWTLNAPV